MNNIFLHSKTSKYIESLIRKSIYEYELLKNCDKLTIALSGGKDSLTLLYMLKKIIGNGVKNVSLSAIHVYGTFSCGAEVNISFLEKTCEKLDIPLHLCESKINLKNLSCYKCSRIRRSLIFEKAKEKNISTIAFGHTKDDLNQTLLLNLFQKGEFASILPKINMYKYGVTLIRPLMYVFEKDISSFAKQNNFLKTRCNCPNSASSYRKKVNDIILSIEKDFPNVQNNLFLSAKKYGSKKANENILK